MMSRDGFSDLVEAERASIVSAGITREQGLRELAQRLERLRGVLPLGAGGGGGTEGGEYLDALEESERAHANYLWDEVGIFSDADVFDTLARVRVLERQSDPVRSVRGDR